MEPLPTIITGVVLALCAVISTLVAWHQYRVNHSDHIDTKLHDTMRQVADDANKPIATSINDHTMRLTQYGDRLNRIEELLKDNSTDVKALTEALSKMGVKVDMYWNTLETMAMHAAKGLHQPDPERARLDHLLEAFIEGTLTPEERNELKKMLVLIRNYEPGGPPLDFPVQQGEQTFAVILLSTMDMVDPLRMAAMGHTLHRSVRDKENRKK